MEFFSRVEAGGATGPMLRLDRQLLAFLPPEEARRWTAPLLRRMGDEGFVRRLVRIYDDFDRLAPLAPDDPAVERFVDRVWDLLPPESRAALHETDFDAVAGPGVLDAVFAEMAPAQVAAGRWMMSRAATCRATQDTQERTSS